MNPMMPLLYAEGSVLWPDYQTPVEPEVLVISLGFREMGGDD